MACMAPLPITGYSYLMGRGGWSWGAGWSVGGLSAELLVCDVEWCLRWIYTLVHRRMSAPLMYTSHCVGTYPGTVMSQKYNTYNCNYSEVHTPALKVAVTRLKFVICKTDAEVSFSLAQDIFLTLVLTVLVQRKTNYYHTLLFDRNWLMMVINWD